MDEPTPKRNYKDSLFCSKFSNPEDLAALHKHINGLPTSPDQITINTLRHALFSQVRNDISFLVGQKFMVLDFSATKTQAIEQLMKRYSLTHEQASAAVQANW